MMKLKHFPAWAPEELVEILNEAYARHNSSRKDLDPVIHVLERLCTDPQMEGAWKSMKRCIQRSQSVWTTIWVSEIFSACIKGYKWDISSRKSGKSIIVNAREISELASELARKLEGYRSVWGNNDLDLSVAMYLDDSHLTNLANLATTEERNTIIDSASDRYKAKAVLPAISVVLKRVALEARNEADFSTNRKPVVPNPGTVPVAAQMRYFARVLRDSLRYVFKQPLLDALASITGAMFDKEITKQDFRELLKCSPLEDPTQRSRNPRFLAGYRKSIRSGRKPVFGLYCVFKELKNTHWPKKV